MSGLSSDVRYEIIGKLNAGMSHVALLFAQHELPNEHISHATVIDISSSHLMLNYSAASNEACIKVLLKKPVTDFKQASHVFYEMYHDALLCRQQQNA